MCVISLCGEFRKGKSFLLNLFLRYLKLNIENKCTPDWIMSGQMLNGFHWRGGSKRETTGIHIWPEAFTVQDSEYGEVVIILMDTQGLWDNQTNNQGNSIIFCLSTLLTSLQVVFFKLSSHFITLISISLKCIENVKCRDTFFNFFLNVFQIFNLSRKFQDNVLKELEYFTKYAELASRQIGGSCRGESGEKFFQVVPFCPIF